LSELRAGWTTTTLGEVSRVVSGSTPRTTEPQFWGGEIAWITPDDLSGYSEKRIARGARSITSAGYESCSTQLMPAGTVLYTSRAPIGYAAIASAPVCTNQGFKSFVPTDAVNSDYLYWFLLHATPQIRKLGSGTTFPELSKKGAEGVPLPLPPLAEQRRIVAAIEEQFSRLDAAEGSLAVGCVRLKALKAIAAARIADVRWPVVRLADVATVVSGQTPKGLTTLPDGPIPFYKVGDMNTANGAAMGAARGYLDGHLAASQKLTVRPIGTVIFPKRGGAIVTNKKRILVRPSAFDLNTMGVVPGAELDQRYLLAWFETVDLNALADGSSVPQINHGDIEPLEIPLPPLEEQRRIVAEVEQQLSLIDSLRAAVESAQKRSAALRRAILECAFRGELVPQDPADEPASALLERIRAERAAAPRPSRRRATMEAS